ncbi:major facilitator superfamily domain-containing protein [Elsinoe ampelina]|uniref:Major facilitator superfamily domain-containing protein n=1 Tax=Elsinoe ampelina TaxID=302913 RepID=A0A6A6GNZ2_9PEZI|nr:major facilitator superfamily domain-containing protein [Elsinoe ampelina]
MDLRILASNFEFKTIDGPRYPPPTRPRHGDTFDAKELTSPSTLNHESPSGAVDDTFFQAGQQTSSAWNTNASSATRTPNEIESNSPKPQENAVGIVPSFSWPPKNKYRVLAACLTYFGNGMNDAAPGALIPYMERGYNIGYAIVSLIFVANAVGFITTAFCSDVVHSKLGRARTLMMSEIIIALGYMVIVFTPQFAAVVASFFLLGLGCAFNLALNNVFVSNLSGSTVLLGAAHGSYGVGGLIAPLICTAMVSNGIPWSRFYIITLGLRVVTFFFTGWANRGYDEEPTSKFAASLELLSSQQAEVPREQTKLQLLKQALRNKTTLLGALFIFAYQGAEVSISGWVISYLITARNGDPAQVGYVTSGFWGGITLGRFVLVYIAGRIGERLSVYILIAGSIGLQLIVWFVPNIIGNAVAVALLGLLLGPVYPCCATIFARLLPSRIQVSSISFISSAGSSGGAVAPFMTGLLAQAVGTYVLHPICIAMFVVMTICWKLLPKTTRKAE